MFCAPDLQLLSINTDNVKDERGDENIHRSRGSSQLCENLLRGEIARQHAWSSKLYFGNSKDPPIAIWLILTILILPILFCKICLLFWPMLTVENPTAMCHLLWRISLSMQCLMCLSTTQAPPKKEMNAIFEIFFKEEHQKWSPESQSSASNQMHHPHLSTTL